MGIIQWAWNKQLSTFSPADVVPAISSPDKMLQARLFSYGDALHFCFGHAAITPTGAIVTPFTIFTYHHHSPSRALSWASTQVGKGFLSPKCKVSCCGKGRKHHFQ